MATYDDHIEFAEEFISFLPPLRDIRGQSDDFWNKLEVNSPQIIQEMSEPDNVASKLPSIDRGAQQVCAMWAGLAPLQDNQHLESFVGHIAANRASTGLQTIILLSQFLYRRRTDAIETISRLILPSEEFNVVCESDIETNSKRFCYALLAYVGNPHFLRTLMLFESAERAGYTRYYLIPDLSEEDDPKIAERLFEEAEKAINQGIDITTLDVEFVNDVLDKFERTHGRKESLCFDIFFDPENEVALVFILRSLREAFIRQIDRLIFGDEADLIVLRIAENIRVIDERSERSIGLEIANEIAKTSLGIQNIKFIKSDETTKTKNLQELFKALMNESDERLQFREIYLETAPVDGSPILMIRSNEGETIVGALRFLENRNVPLMQDYSDINNIKIGFVVEKSDGSLKPYSIKVFFSYIGQNLYYLTYSTANIASHIREDFENYLRENYNVRVIPGKG
jgi:hypothetical protein